MNREDANRTRPAGPATTGVPTTVVAGLLLVLALIWTTGCGGGGAAVNNDDNTATRNTNTDDNGSGNQPDNVPANTNGGAGATNNAAGSNNANANTNTSTPPVDTAALRRRAEAALQAADELAAAGNYAQATAAYDALIAEYGESLPDVAETAGQHQAGAQLDAELKADEAISALLEQLSALDDAPEGSPPVFVAAEELLAGWPAELAATAIADSRLPELRGRYAAMRERWMVEWSDTFDRHLIMREYDAARDHLGLSHDILGDSAAGRELDRLERVRAANAQLDAAVEAVAQGQMDAAAELLAAVESNPAWSDLPLRVLDSGEPKLIADYRAEVLEAHFRARVESALAGLETELAGLDATPPATAAVEAYLDAFDPALRDLVDVAAALSAARQRVNETEAAFLQTLAETRVPQLTQRGDYQGARQAIAAARQALRESAAAGLDALLAIVEKAAEADGGAAVRLLQTQADEDLAHAESLAQTGDYAAAYAIVERVAANDEFQRMIPDRVETATARAADYLARATAEANDLLDRVHNALGEIPDLMAAHRILDRFPERLLIDADVERRYRSLRAEYDSSATRLVSQLRNEIQQLARERYYERAAQALDESIRAVPPGRHRQPLLDQDQHLKAERAAYLAQAGREPLPPADDAGMHAPLDRLVRTYVDDAGRVNYDAIAANADLLDGYLATLGKTDPSAIGRSDRLALWINAYNAFALKLALRHRAAVDSLRDLPDAWTRAEWSVNGTRYSLDQIEHQQIGAAFRDARVHAALVCGARSAPPLQAGVWVGARLDAQLDDAMRRLLADDTRGATIAQSPAGTELRLSKVFEWFLDDFGGSHDRLVEFVAPFLPADLRSRVADAGRGLIVSWLDYDWSLNAQRPE